MICVRTRYAPEAPRIRVFLFGHNRAAYLRPRVREELPYRYIKALRVAVLPRSLRRGASGQDLVM